VTEAGGDPGAGDSCACRPLLHASQAVRQDQSCAVPSLKKPDKRLGLQFFSNGHDLVMVAFTIF
jgi:hypothetical protein